MRAGAGWILVAAAGVGGFAFAQDSAETDRKLAAVRREVKQLDLETTLDRVPALVTREKEYRALAAKIQDAATGGAGDVEALLQQAREMKMAALRDLNQILKLHQSPFVGIERDEVMRRLESTRVTAVNYTEEWLVNILDDLEQAAQVNIEMDARVYKYDTVTFSFDDTTARALLQTLADSMEFKWTVRGDTLYVYKERYEVLFDEEWLKKATEAWKARLAEKQAQREGAPAEGGEEAR